MYMLDSYKTRKQGFQTVHRFHPVSVLDKSTGKGKLQALYRVVQGPLALNSLVANRRKFQSRFLIYLQHDVRNN